MLLARAGKHAACGLAVVAALSLLSGCATAGRVTRVVVDHHVGMFMHAKDVLSGEASARAERIAALREKLKDSRAAIDSEVDPESPERSVELLRRHIELQDALLAELEAKHGHGGGHHSASSSSQSSSPSDSGGASRDGHSGHGKPASGAAPDAASDPGES